jgi:hypothetical protein
MGTMDKSVGAIHTAFWDDRDAWSEIIVRPAWPHERDIYKAAPGEAWSASFCDPFHEGCHACLDVEPWECPDNDWVAGVAPTVEGAVAQAVASLTKCNGGVAPTRVVPGRRDDIVRRELDALYGPKATEGSEAPRG